jgi:putative GTP pyrophosphokinase
MSFPQPQYSKTQVNKAGIILTSDIDAANFDVKSWLWAFGVLSNWRACHSYLINTFNSNLRKKLKKIDSEALVAQRLKRTPSILHKLERFRSMQLSRMQDIGGLRAIVGTPKKLNELYEAYKRSNFSHDLVSEYDYVQSPKSSGYRSIHLVYRYKKRFGSPYDGYHIELQLRTKLQHAWATAVETSGTFLEHSLKSSEGPDEWLRFFALTGSAFSYLEGTQLVPEYQYLTKKETFEKTLAEAKRLDIRKLLLGYSLAVSSIPQGSNKSAYYLIELNLIPEEKSVKITPFKLDNLEEANIAYSKAEERTRNGEPLQVVLVSAGSLDSLRRAYPNYFLDTHDFLNQLKRIERQLNAINSKAK